MVPILFLNDKKRELKYCLLPNYSYKGMEHLKSSLSYAILEENPIL